MPKRVCLLLGLVVISNVSCGQSSHVSELEKKTQILTMKIESLQKDNENLKKDIESLKNDKRADDIVANFGKVAYLTPGAEGYSVIESDIVKLTVSLENIQPYANGSRVTIKFGNISNATINDLKGTIEWGQVDEKGLPQNDKALSKEIIFNKPLRSGSWTNIQMVLEGVPPTGLGFVRVSELSHKGISLLNEGRT